MKNFKYFILAALFTLFASSCSNDGSNNEQTSQESFNLKSLNEETFVQSITITTTDGRVINGSMTGKVNGDTGELLSFVFSQNILDAKIGINPDTFVDEMVSYGEGSDSPHSICIQKCKDKHIDPATGKKYTDGRGVGYGGCRFSCWVDTAVRIIEALSPVLKAVI